MSKKLTPDQRNVLESHLFSSKLTAYAVVDSAMSNEIHIMIQTDALDYRCLYEGKEADLLEEAAPYLVQIEQGDYLTGWLLENVYKKNAISFIKTEADIEQLANHLRQYAKIQAVSHGDDGKLTKQWAFFAFYDPRVFPRFIKGNTAEQSAEFFEGIDQYICENADDKNKLQTHHFAEKDQKVITKELTLNKTLENKQEEKTNG